MFLDNFRHLVRVELRVKDIAGGYQHHGANRAGAHAAGDDHLDFVADPGLFGLGGQRLFDDLTVGGYAARAAADVHDKIVLALRVQIGFLDVLKLFEGFHLLRHYTLTSSLVYSASIDLSLSGVTCR